MKKYADLILILAISIGLRLIYVLHMSRNDPFFYNLFSDSLQYHQLALAILKNGIIGNQAFYHPPLYQYFLASIYALLGTNLLVPRIIQTIFGTINVMLCYILARRYFDKKVAVVAGSIAALYPMLIFFEGEILTPTLVIFLVLLGLYLLDKKGETNFLLAGFVFGLAALTMQNILVIVLFFPLYLVIRFRKVLVKPLILFWLGALLIVVPVVIRNYVVLKEPILITWQGGINFYFGNNPEADGIARIAYDFRGTDWQSVYQDLKGDMEKEVGHPLSIAEFDRQCFARGLDFVYRNPAKTIGLWFKKVYLFLGGYEISSEKDIYRTAQSSFLKFLIFRLPFMQFPFGLILPLALAGLYLARTRWHELSFLLLFLVLYSGSFIAFAVNARYRMPLIPILIIFAAAFVVSFFTGKERKRLIVPSIIFLVSFIVFNANFYGVTDPNIYMTKYQMAQVFFSQKKFDQALREIEISIKNNPHFAHAHNLRGLIMKTLGRNNDAEREYLVALSLDSTFADPYINLGNLCVSRGDLAKAESYFLKAVQQDPNSAIGYNNLGNLCYQKGLYRDALIDYQRALAINPTYLSAMYHAGLAYYGLGDMFRAESLWSRVLELDRTNEAARKALQVFTKKIIE